MDKETVALLVRFLMRVPLKGEEVPAFNKVMLALEAMSNA